MASPASVSAALVRPLAALLADQPESLAALWARTGLTAALVAAPDGRITAEQLRLAWLEAERLTGSSTLALHVAAATPPGTFGVVEYVCRSASHVGAALRQWIRYLHLLNPTVQVGIVEEEGQARVRVLSETAATAPAMHELCFALLVAEARRISAAPWAPLAVEFAHRTPHDRAAWVRFFGAPVRFGTDATQVILPAAALTTPLATADPALHAILAPLAESLSARVPREPPFTAEVRRVLAEALREDGTQVETVAARLGLTPRSLQRRLKDEGASFQLLRDEVRREHATRYLDDPRLSIAEVSFLVGFSEPSAFFRAFKRWTGRTPLETRAARA